MSKDKGFRGNEGDAFGPGATALTGPNAQPPAAGQMPSPPIAPAHTIGPCSWNGNEIVDASGLAVAGLAPSAPDEWGPLFAAAPDLLAALKDIVAFCDDPEGSSKPESLAMGLSRLLPAAREAVSKATQQ